MTENLKDRMRTEALSAFAEHGVSLAEVRRALEILDAACWPEWSEEKPGLARLLKRASRRGPLHRPCHGHSPCPRCRAAKEK